MATLLQTVQRFCKRTGLNSPSTVLGSTDSQVLQILALLEEEGNDLSARGEWQVLVNEATHTTVATESQGAITTIASNGFKYIKNGTIWDRSNRIPIYVVDSTEWQHLKAISVSGPRYQARIRGNNLLVTPTPTAGLTWAFEYMSKNWIIDTGGTTYYDYFAADTDVILLDEKIVLMGLRWRWKKEKGMEYAEDFRTYETQVKDALTREGMRRNLNMGGASFDARPGVVIPDEFTSLA